MMSLTFGLLNQVSGLGPLGPLVSITDKRLLNHGGVQLRCCFFR